MFGTLALLLAVQSAAAPEGPPLTGLFRGKDYPIEALRKGEQGTVHYALTVGKKGRPKGCWVTQSSGSKSLDYATCKILMKRAKFTRAVDQNGNPTEDVVRGEIHWQFRY